MKLFCSIAWLAILAVGLNGCSCRDKNEKKDSSSAAKEINDKKFNRAKEKDASFVVDILAASYGEIQMAQLARRRSANKETRDLAGMLESDYTAFIDELKTYAAKKNITIPQLEELEAKNALDSLGKLKNREFDKAWCKYLQDEHKLIISTFETASNDLVDEELKGWVNKMLPTLRMHHDKLMTCYTKLK